MVRTTQDQRSTGLRQDGDEGVLVPLKLHRDGRVEDVVLLRVGAGHICIRVGAEIVTVQANVGGGQEALPRLASDLRIVEAVREYFHAVGKPGSELPVLLSVDDSWPRLPKVPGPVRGKIARGPSSEEEGR